MIKDEVFFWMMVSQFGLEEACKVTVEPFVAADKFVAEAKARHESVLFSQNTVQKEPEKKMPLMAANAIISLAKLALVGLHHLRAQLALRWTHGTVSMAWSRCSFSVGSLTYVSMRREYVLLWMFFTTIWKP